MNRQDTFAQFLASQTPHVELGDFIANMALTIVLAIILAAVYNRYATTLSNRQVFSRNLLLLSLIVMLIITVVKSSLALSLGLVGALSIVRFRTPIKEPEELTYIFLAIAVGLGLGAGQRIVVTAGFAVIVLAILVTGRSRVRENGQSLSLSVSSDQGGRKAVDRIVEALSRQARLVRLRRLEEADDFWQADFAVVFDSYEDLAKMRETIAGIAEGSRVSVIDNRMM
jgi:hypothetical protein